MAGLGYICLYQMQEAVVYKPIRIHPEDLSIRDLLDRILEKGIVFPPWDRVTLIETDLHRSSNRIVIAHERRRTPFIVPPTPNQASE
jgi:hypothetical protein